MTRRKETQARISYQRFFRRYLQLAGMTGTAREVAGELWSIYRLRVVTVPTNRPLQRTYLPDRVYPTGRTEMGSGGQSYFRNPPRRPASSCGHSLRCRFRASEPPPVGSGPAPQGIECKAGSGRSGNHCAAGEQARITVATNMAGRGTDIRLAPGVAELGGLHVIATERHEARRIDRQLFGRCGRQGDPGTSEAIVSLEDELVTVYVSKPFQWVAALFLRRPDMLIAPVGREDSIL